MYRRKMSLRTVEWSLAWGKPMREARDPCTRRATRRASIRFADRGVWACHVTRTMRVWGFGTMLPTRLGVDIMNTRHRLHHDGAPLGDALAASPSLHGPRRRRVRGRAH